MVRLFAQVNPLKSNEAANHAVRDRDLIIPDQRKITILAFLRILVFYSASSLFKSYCNLNQKCIAVESQVQV